MAHMGPAWAHPISEFLHSLQAGPWCLETYCPCRCQDENWWHTVGLPNPRVFDATDLDSMHHFLPVYEGEAVVRAST